MLVSAWRVVIDRDCSGAFLIVDMGAVFDIDCPLSRSGVIGSKYQISSCRVLNFYAVGAEINVAIGAERQRVIVAPVDVRLHEDVAVTRQTKGGRDHDVLVGQLSLNLSSGNSRLRTRA